jgi:aspartate kinase
MGRREISYIEDDLLYIIPQSMHSKDDLLALFRKHTEIKFVSLVGIDLRGNDTDERIPIRHFLNDINEFLREGVQTDGSSVVLPGIATLNNGQVDLIADTTVNWFVDYNYEHMDYDTGRPVGTLRIPSYLVHNGKRVDSRSVLQRSIDYFKLEIIRLLQKRPSIARGLGIALEDIEDICLIAATELEFWVKTPDEKAEIEELCTSQVLQEQYWKRTKGDVRTALEKSILLLERYGLQPEMGHKEVGGVKAKIGGEGKFNHIMEQLEINWLYAPALQAADNELVARILIKETFRKYGLEVTFMAKPIEGVLMKVVKFGGSSLATADQIKKVCNIVISDPDRRLMVVSAPGKRLKEDVKVTDLLIKCAKSHLAGESSEKYLEAIVSRYREISQQLNMSDEIIEQIEADLRFRLSLDKKNSGRFIDSLKAAGEDNCAKLVASYLQCLGIEAQYVNPKSAGLLLSNEYGNAHVLPESYENLKKLANIQGIVVFPGFFGYSKSGDIVTFSRGGSDITGSILAAAVNADLYENFTDVDCVYSANPNIISNPQPIVEITYKEMRELSYAGFSVFHEEALVPVYNKGIPVRIKNTNNPNAVGTTIIPFRNDIKNPVVGVSGDTGFCCVSMSKYLMNREVGFGRKVLNILEDENLSFEHMPSGIDNMSVILKEKQLRREAEERIVQRIKTELHVDDVFVQRNLALIMIVGEGMQSTVGIASRATTSLANAGINIEMISQGFFEFSMMFGVKEDKCVSAIKALYNEFF